MLWVGTQVPFIAPQHHLRESHGREHLESILASQCLSWGWILFLYFCLLCEMKGQNRQSSWNTLHCSSGFAGFLRKDNIWFIKGYILFLEGSSPKNVTEYKAVVADVLPHIFFFFCGRAGDPGLCYHEFKLRYIAIFISNHHIPRCSDC